MKTVIENINDITDSTELLESRPPSFTVIFIYLLIGLLVIAFAWTYIGEIDIVVKANGVVRPNQRISTINNIVTGKIDELYIENGKAVKKNDILYTLDYRDLQIRQTFIEEQIAMKKTDLKNQNTLKYSVIENKNSFIMQEDQEFYYYKYLKYEADKKQTIENVNLVINTIYNTQKILQNTQILLASIEENENLFKNTENEYYIKYLDYTFNKKDLQKDIDKKKINFEILEKLYKAGALAKFDYENAKDELEKAHLELERFENTTRLTLKSNIEENQRKLEQLKIQLQQIAPGVSTAIENHAEIAAENFRTENLILINETIKHLETEINQLENDLAGVKLDIQNCIIKAPIDGNINIITEINRGDNIVAGTTIATIIPEDDDNSYVIQIYA